VHGPRLRQGEAARQTEPRGGGIHRDDQLGIGALAINDNRRRKFRLLTREPVGWEPVEPQAEDALVR